MNIILAASFALFILLNQAGYSQSTPPDTTKNKKYNLQEVVFSVNKTEELKRNIAQQIHVIEAKEIAALHAQSTAEVLANSGNVFVQKSQGGGGSVNLRGFEANRILLVIDGVRMNNLIYRGGHLQNIITTDNNSLDRVEILFGPSSTIYGSDALGGVVHLYTKKPIFGSEGRKAFKVNFLSRYGSVNNELTNHLDVNLGSNKFASLTSLNYSLFDDLKGGENQNPFYNSSYGERPIYAERINGKDSIIANSNRYKQVSSGYTQYDLMQKFLYRQNVFLSHLINLQFSNSSNIPRYDRLTDPTPQGLKYAEWYYGPQTRLLAAYDLNYKKPSSKLQNFHLGLNYQKIVESRHTRRFGSNSLQHRFEHVDVLGLNLGFQEEIKLYTIRFGADFQFNKLKSTANQEDIVTNKYTPLDTRYPDGENAMFNLAIYASHTWKITNQLILVDGLRVGFSSLNSTFINTSFFPLPFSDAKQNNPVYSGSLGLISTPAEDWKLSLLLSTGYRVPNVDDLSKVFESAPGMIIVPNPNLSSEKTINTELGITKIINGHTSWENSVYYTQFFDAIITEKFSINGQDSILYDGVMSRVFANTNKQEAYIYGVSSNLNSQLNEHFRFGLSLNYTYGRIKTDSSNIPLGHISPLMIRTYFTCTFKNFSSQFFVNFNGWKKLKDYYLNGEDNEQYATPDGMPAWITANIRLSYKIFKIVSLQTGVDNIFDNQYRTFASGINAPGRNVFAAVSVNF